MAGDRAPNGAAEGAYKPDGWHDVTPRIVVHDVGGLVAFMRMAFGAIGDFQAGRPCEMRIRDSVVMVGSAAEREVMPAFLYLYVEDTAAAYRRAIDAGATSIEEPRDTPYGDRRGMIRDSWGNIWQIATRELRG